MTVARDGCSTFGHHASAAVRGDLIGVRVGIDESDDPQVVRENHLLDGTRMGANRTFRVHSSDGSGTRALRVGVDESDDPEVI